MTWLPAEAPRPETTTVRYYSVDAAGDAEQPKAQLARIDAAAPAVNITAPAGGSSYKRGTSVTVSATATDSGTGSGAPAGVAKVTFRVDGTTVATDTSAPYQFTWNTRKSSVGQHTLTAVATDGAGNTTTSAPVTVTITK